MLNLGTLKYEISYMTMTINRNSFYVSQRTTTVIHYLCTLQLVVPHFRWKTESDHESLMCSRCAFFPSASADFLWLHRAHVRTVLNSGTHQQPERRHDETSTPVRIHSHSPCQSALPDCTFITYTQTSIHRWDNANCEKLPAASIFPKLAIKSQIT